MGDNGRYETALRVLKYVNGDWVQVRNVIDPPERSTYPEREYYLEIAEKVALSDDGTRVATLIRTPYRDYSVSVYDLKDNLWKIIGEPILSRSNKSCEGFTRFSLSGDGNTIAVSDRCTKVNRSFVIQVFEFVPSQNEPKLELRDELKIPSFGGSVSLDKNGSVLAVAYGQVVEVYRWDAAASSYEIVGDSLDTKKLCGSSARSVAISYDGLRVAFVCPYDETSGNNKGSAVALEYDDSHDEWTRLGSPGDMEVERRFPVDSRFPRYVALSRDGSRLLVDTQLYEYSKANAVLIHPGNVTVQCGRKNLAATGTASGRGFCTGLRITKRDSSESQCGGEEIITRQWTATDDCNNKVTQKQFITVVDREGPTFKKESKGPIKARCGANIDSLLSKAGFSAFDRCEGDLTSKIFYEANNVLLDRVGEYFIRVGAKDSCNNTQSTYVQFYLPYRVRPMPPLTRRVKTAANTFSLKEQDPLSFCPTSLPKVSETWLDLKIKLKDCDKKAVTDALVDGNEPRLLRIHKVGPGGVVEEERYFRDEMELNGKVWKIGVNTTLLGGAGCYEATFWFPYPRHIIGRALYYNRGPGFYATAAFQVE